MRFAASSTLFTRKPFSPSLICSPDAPNVSSHDSCAFPHRFGNRQAKSLSHGRGSRQPGSTTSDGRGWSEPCGRSRPRRGSLGSWRRSPVAIWLAPPRSWVMPLFTDQDREFLHAHDWGRILAEPTRGQASEKVSYRSIATIIGVAASIAIMGLSVSGERLDPRGLRRMARHLRLCGRIA